MSPTPESLLRVGAVPYLNARPLVSGLADDPRVEYLEDHPSRLAARLHEGMLDCALASSIETLRDDVRFVPGIGIASRGPVWSVRLVGREDPRHANTVALDGASLTAATLTRILFEQFWEQDVHFVRTDPAPDPATTGADATLIIGDPALPYALDDDRSMQSLDLGEAWTEATGLPFVWALWLARSESDLGRAEPILKKARDEGVDRDADHIRWGADRLPIAKEGIRRYLTEIMVYDLGEAELEGLEAFRRLARHLRQS